MVKPISRRTTAISLALSLAAAGCGAAACPTAQPTAVATTATATVAPASPSFEAFATPILLDPCTLVTQAEADHLAGTPLASGVPSGSGGIATLCMWTGDPTGPLGQVEVYVGDGAKKFFDLDHDALKHPFTAVAGLGDEAWAEDNAVFFRKGTLWVGLHLVRLNDAAENAAALEDIARRIATRF
jgi:hypothetical protein